MSWMIRLCYLNMKRRGVRTVLTLLGVAIGVVSVVSLIAVGIGVKRELLKDYENGDTVRTITVYGEQNSRRTDRMLTKRTIQKLEEMSHVEVVYPVYEVYATLKLAPYSTVTTIYGVPAAYLERFELTENSEKKERKNKPDFIFGDQLASLFFNENTGECMADAKDVTMKDLIGKKMNVTYGLEDNGFTESVLVGAVMEREDSGYRMESQSIYCDLDVWLRYLKQNSANGSLPGQTMSGEDSELPFVYTSAMVVVDDVDAVDDLVKQLQDMGFQTVNEKEYLDTAKKTIKTMQLLLGGIGMIALIVAVIGIGNTMTTAVYDRVAEIGMLKVLGCDLDELLCLFLMESGILGAVGGISGGVLSYGIRGILNRIAVHFLQLEKGTELVCIPAWLMLSAILFSTVMGLLAGYFPAKWAAGIAPVEAMQGKR